MSQTVPPPRLQKTRVSKKKTKKTTTQVSNHEWFTHKPVCDEGTLNAWSGARVQDEVLESRRIGAKAGYTSSAPWEPPLPKALLLFILKSWDSTGWSSSLGKLDRRLASSNTQFMDMGCLYMLAFYRWAWGHAWDAWVICKPASINLCRKDTTYLFLLRLN